MVKKIPKTIETYLLYTLLTHLISKSLVLQTPKFMGGFLSVIHPSLHSTSSPRLPLLRNQLIRYSTFASAFGVLHPGSILGAISPISNPDLLEYTAQLNAISYEHCGL